MNSRFYSTVAVYCVRIDTTKVGLDVTGTVEFDGDKISEAPPIWAAAAAGHLAIVRLLLESGADVNQTTASSSTALRGACYDGHLQVVALLVESGADVEICNQYGHSPLMIAAYREKAECVSFLIDKGANVNRSSLKGNTALHDAAECGSLEIVDLLIKAGAILQKDEYGLSPIMGASMIGHEAIVDYFAKYREQFGKCLPLNEIVDAYKLLGATCVDKRREISTALGHWRKAVRLLETSSSDADTACSSSGVDVTRHCDAPPDVYRQDRELAESRSLEEISTDPDALRMQALVIRERVLSGRHPETHYYLRYRGAIYADVGRYTRCFELWLHALKLQQECLDALSPVTLATILAFAETFSYMLNDRSIAGVTLPRGHHAEGDDDRNGPTFEIIFVVLKAAVDEVERGMAKCKWRRCAGTVTCHGRLCVISLYLLSLVGRLDPAIAKESQEQRLLALVHRFVRLQPVICCGGNLLHAACNEETGTGPIGKYPPTRFPSLFVLKMLVHVGIDVNGTDSKGRSPLHVVLSCKTPRISMIKYLLENGAHIDLRSNDKISPYDEIIKRPRIRREIFPWDKLSLKCLAATVISEQNISYKNLVPLEMEEFIQMH